MPKGRLPLSIQVPIVLERMLKDEIFPRAKVDVSIDVAARLRSDPDVRQVIRDNERLLRLLFLINAPGADWALNEAFQTGQGKETPPDVGGVSIVIEAGQGEKSPPTGAAATQSETGAMAGWSKAVRRREEKRCDEEKWLYQVEAEAVAAAKTAQHNSQFASPNSPGVYGNWKSPRGKELEPCVSLDAWIHLMSRTANGWVSIELFQQSAITGVPAIKRRWQVGLEEEGAKLAFISCRNVCELDLPGLSFDDVRRIQRRIDGETTKSSHTRLATATSPLCLDTNMYVNAWQMTSALALCGDQMYANVQSMTPAQRVHGAIKNALGLTDHETIVFDATYVHLPSAFDAREACQELLTSSK